MNNFFTNLQLQNLSVEQTSFNHQRQPLQGPGQNSSAQHGPELGPGFEKFAEKSQPEDFWRSRGLRAQLRAHRVAHLVGFRLKNIKKSWFDNFSFFCFLVFKWNSIEVLVLLLYRISMCFYVNWLSIFLKYWLFKD